MSDTLKTIFSFIDAIGLDYLIEPIAGDTFLPGLQLKSGALIIDLEKLLYPGDILHEAGHLACMPPNIRQNMNEDLENNDLNQGGEMMALAWSYAACIHLGIDPEIVFHKNGYKGQGENIVQNFNSGNILGLPLLQWHGMSYDAAHAEKNGKKPFPYMVNWICRSDHA